MGRILEYHRPRLEPIKEEEVLMGNDTEQSKKVKIKTASLL